MVAAGLPAVYQDFGEHLLYRDGSIFDAAHGAPAETPILKVDSLDETVGLEYGWRHASGCTCAYCRSARSERDEAATAWGTGRASA